MVLKFFLVVAFFLGCRADDTARTVEDSCPSDVIDAVGAQYFQIYGDQCYLFMAYDKTWYALAQNKCEFNGGTLAMPKTKDVNDFLVDTLTSVYKRDEPVWIGMHDKADEGKPLWEDGSEVEWENFDYYFGGVFGWDEDCVALDLLDRRWHDYKCFYDVIDLISGVPKGFICQYDFVSGGGNSTQLDRSED